MKLMQIFLLRVIFYKQ